jgi:hypothetical protein
VYNGTVQLKTHTGGAAVELQHRYVEIHTDQEAPQANAEEEAQEDAEGDPLAASSR